MNIPRPISKAGVTPEVLAQHVSKDAADMEQVYVIAFSKSGEVWQYLSGDTKGMALASCILSDNAVKTASGQL